MADSYDWLRLRAAGADSTDLLRELRTVTAPVWTAAGWHLWGVWQGLFGIASDELLVMAARSGELPAPPPLEALPAAATVVDSLALLSTVRPQRVDPLQEPGLYVFRTFEVRPTDCDAVVALSQRAWETFEAAQNYRSRPCGLFRPRRPVAALERMLLLTWYDGFASWETSRLPAPRARENFDRRRALTVATVAYASRLAVPPERA